MQYLWQDPDKIISSLKKYHLKLLILDFDGTLTPIAKAPEKAILSESIKDLLRQLSQKPNYFVAISSGRELGDLKAKVGLTSIIYGANHGFEGEVFGKKYSYPLNNKTLKILQEIRRQLENKLSQFKGVFIEDKGLTLSLHYRLAHSKQIHKIKALAKITLDEFIKDGVIFTISGKMVIDILPKTDWNKGRFADFIVKSVASQNKSRPLIIAIGDDKTDEDTFNNLKNGITIKVGGKNQSNAKYYVKSTKEVIQFLKTLVSC